MASQPAPFTWPSLPAQVSGMSARAADAHREREEAKAASRRAPTDGTSEPIDMTTPENSSTAPAQEAGSSRRGSVARVFEPGARGAECPYDQGGGAAQSGAKKFRSRARAHGYQALPCPAPSQHHA